MTRQPNAPGYEEDFAAWLEDQARHARCREIGALDLDNIAEELEGLARSDRREIRNRLTVLLVHLLEYRFQPHRRPAGWLATIGEQRTRIASVLDDSPSLRAFPRTVIDRCYTDARSRTVVQTRLPATTFPERCPFGVEEVLDLDWLPAERVEQQ